MIRKIAKSLIPTPIWNRLGILRRKWHTRDDAQLTTREVFSRIYSKRIWGGEDEAYSSGHGSRAPFIVQPYIEAIKAWAESNDSGNMVALDLGCGDFHVGRQLYPLFKHYIAADIVPDLIDHHRDLYRSSSLEFRCVDAIEDPLPDADVVFVRQVLQHLSNEQILQILPKLTRFRLAIVTEHLPSPEHLVAENLNKEHGGSVRVEKGSGIFLEKPPFSLPFLESSILLNVPSQQDSSADGIIVTTAYRFR